MGRRLALLIATYEYQDAGLRQLTAPAHDAEALAAVLRDPDIAGFEVTTLVNEPHHLVGEAVGDFYNDRRRDDLTLLYFTGHGLKDDGGRLYLAMANTRRDRLLFTAISGEQIDRAMEGCASRQKVLILDCCYSGAFPAGLLAKADTAVHTLERFQGRGRTVLTASDATQYSFEGNQPHGEATQSVFTHHLVAGLRNGSADLDGDGDITLDELYSYVHDRVVEEMPQQRPKRQDNVEGRIVIARNINWTLPGYLRNAITSPIASDRLAALDGLDHLRRIGNDLVRTQVFDEIRRLADDDSKVVSAAAAARLEAAHPAQSGDLPVDAPASPIENPPPSIEAAPPEPPPEALPATAPPYPRPDLAPVTASAPPPASAPASAPAHAAPVADPPPPSPAAGKAPQPGGPVAVPPRRRRGLGFGAVAAAMLLATSLPVRARDNTDLDVVITVAALLFLMTAALRPLAREAIEDRTDRLARLPGVLAILASGLMVAGIAQRPIAASTPGFWSSLPWYIIGLAAVATTAGVCTVLPRTRSSIGPGLMVGAAAASTWGLVFFTGQLLREPSVARLVVAVGHLALMVAAALAGRTVPAQLRLRRPASAVVWTMVVLAGLATAAAAAAMSIEVYQITYLHWDYKGLPAGDELRDRAFAYRTTMVLAVCVPLYAAVVGPRRYGLSVLAGWIGGAAAIAVSTDAYVRQSDWTARPPVLIFGSALLLVAAVAVGAARLPKSPDHPPPAGPRRRALVLAGIALVSLVVTVAGSLVAFQAAVRDKSRPIDALAISPDGSRVFVTRDSSVYTIDTARQKVIGHLVGVGDGSGAPVVSPDGSRVYVTTNKGVAVIDSGAAPRSGPYISGATSQMAVTPDGRRLYLATYDGVSVIDLRTIVSRPGTGSDLTPVAAIPVGESGYRRKVAVSPDGNRLYVASYKNGVSIIDTQTNKIVGGPIPVGDEQPLRMVVSPDGRRLYVAGFNSNGPNHLFVIDTMTNTTVGSPLEAGCCPAISPDGRRLYALNFNGISVIDTGTNHTVGTPIPAGLVPHDMAMSADGRSMYVIHYDDDTVWAVDLVTRRTVGIPIRP
ncbi:caspase family protein [Micromonospora sp. CPCC 205371]|nr:caspase family protein [Micromonospora sp. CPCC 205371]